MQCLRKALTTCKYPKWALDKVERKFINNNQKESNVGNKQAELSENDSNNPYGNPEGRDSTKEKYNKGHIVLYIGTRREYQKHMEEVCYGTITNT